MKIMQIIPYFCFGGAETMCENLCYSLTNMGYSVVAVCLYDRPTPISQRMEQRGIPLRFLDKKPGMDLSMIPKLAALMRQEKPDVVHTHLNVIKYAAPAARLAGVKQCVHTVHNVAEQEAENRVEKISNRFFFRWGWALPVALSPLVRDTILSFYRLPPERVDMVCNGVNLSRCRPKLDYTLSDPPKLVHIGRFNEQKNHFVLLDAFARIHQQVPACRLQLIGEGDLERPVRDYARQLGLMDSVDFLGSQPDVGAWLYGADVFVLPSKYEGMPMTLIEAMGTGLPVVASAVGGVPDMIADGQSGLLVEPEASAVSEAVLRLLKDQSLRQKLGSSALEQSGRFGAEHMARLYATVYNKEKN